MLWRHEIAFNTGALARPAWLERAPARRISQETRKARRLRRWAWMGLWAYCETFWSALSGFDLVIVALA
jgi:hypothetical protein